MAPELNCQQALEQLQADEPDPRQQQRVLAHLERCPACAAAARWEAFLRQSLGAWPVPDPTADLSARIGAMVRQTSPAPLPQMALYAGWAAAVVVMIAASLLVLRQGAGANLLTQTRAVSVLLSTWVGAAWHDLIPWWRAVQAAAGELVGWMRQWQTLPGPPWPVWAVALFALLAAQIAGWWWTRRQTWVIQG